MLNAIQALIFSVLTLMFIVIAIESHQEEDHAPEEAHGLEAPALEAPGPEAQGLQPAH
jgi:hypothetical protein